MSILCTTVLRQTHRGFSATIRSVLGAIACHADRLARSECGNAVLYTMIAVPLVLTLTVLAVDVSRFQALRERAQDEADRIALLAVKALPDQEEARRIALAAASSLRDLSVATDAKGAPQLEIYSNRISLVLEGSVAAVFDTVVTQRSGVDLHFTVRERGEAQVVPADYVLILSDAHSLRPPAHTAWGAPVAWPASTFFNFVLPPQLIGDVLLTDDAAGVYWGKWWEAFNSDLYRRWATQACFNPYYSELKYAAISVSDVAGSLGGNRIGLLFSPGEDARVGFSVGRLLGFCDSQPGSQALWQGYFESESYISDESCAVFADTNASAQERYALPPPPSFVPLPQSRLCTERLSRTGWGELYYPYGLLNECVPGESLSLREAIYFHAARSTAHANDGANIVAAIDQAFLQLTVMTDAQSQENVARRGTLATSPGRYVLVLTDKLPNPDAPAFAELRERLTLNTIQLYFVVLAAPVLPESERAQLQIFAEKLRQGAGEGVRILIASSPEELTSAVLPTLLHLGRKYVIRS